MSAAAVVTLILVGVLVVALALYLARIVVILHRINDQLGKVTFGVRAIANQTKPINDLTASMNQNLGAVADALDQLVADVTEVPDSESAA